MAKFSQEIEVSGHLIDSSILTKIFDKIMDLDGEFQVEEINIGKKKKDPSYARLSVTGKNQKHLDEILETIYREGAVSKIQRGISLKKAPKDMVMPDDFYSTTNNHTQVFHNGKWIQVENMMMDKCIVVKDNRPFCVPVRDVKKGDQIIVGEGGIKITPPERPREGVNVFEFMGSSSSSERPTRTCSRPAAHGLDEATAQVVEALKTVLRDGDADQRKRPKELLDGAGKGGLCRGPGGPARDRARPARRRHRHRHEGREVEAHRAALGRLRRPQRGREAADRARRRRRDRRRRDGNQALHLAGYRAPLATAQALLDARADPNAGNERQLTPLHIAAAEGNKAVVELLLARGADPKAKGQRGESPLHWAASQGRSEVVQLRLLAKVGDVNLPDMNGVGPVFYAALGGHTELVRMLLDRKAGTKAAGFMADVQGTPLHEAARGGHIATMELLISRGVPLNAGQFGKKALHVAAGAGRKAPVESAHPVTRHT